MPGCRGRGARAVIAALPPLYVVADLDFVGDVEPWLQRLAALNALGKERPSAFAIQIRAKRREDDSLATIAHLARQAIREVPLVLNGPSRLAAELGYDGVHWPAASIPSLAEGTTDAVGLAIRTAAIHSAAAAAAAERAGATALVFAPVYAPRWKAVPGAGLDALREAVGAATRPVYALGGVTPARAAACIDAGAHGIAVLSGVMRDAPAAATVGYLEALQEAGLSRAGTRPNAVADQAGPTNTMLGA